MKPEIKKQIILHLPYLAFVYLFGKVGQAFRLAQGADLSAKLLHIGQGFSAAFASAAPSFHPTDLLIGLAAAVIIRLVVYSKQKNAKKYRKGMEYGTARCSTFPSSFAVLIARAIVFLVTSSCNGYHSFRFSAAVRAGAPARSATFS